MKGDKMDDKMDDNEITKQILEKRKEKKKSKKNNEVEIPTCDVCRENKAIGVFCVPSVPISCAYCVECYNMNAHPWWILVSNTACAGGLDKTADWWKWMVTDTCDHLGKSMDVFLEEVKIDIQKLDAYNEEYYKKERAKYEQKLFADCKFKGTYANCKPECCIKCHDEGHMADYKEHAGCNE